MKDARLGLNIRQLKVTDREQGLQRETDRHAGREGDRHTDTCSLYRSVDGASLFSATILAAEHQNIAK